MMSDLPNDGGASLPTQVETVLLDAGGVLLDLDYAYLLRLIQAHRLDITTESLARSESLAREEIDRHVRNGGTSGDAWRDYFHFILGQVEVAPELRDGIIDSLWEAHQRVGLWTVAVAGGPEAVAQLKQAGYRLAVVSNAEGLVARDLDEAGYEGLFETVVDSHLVGVQKPDPRIFEIALEKLKAGPESAIFVGDVPAVDVDGARAAGITPILVDPHDLHTEKTVLRIPSIAELPELLQTP
jgi:putative hydrolase of the HAD superfamily